MTLTMNSLIQITTTNDDPAELENISTHLIEHKLAACCQISGPISSHYIWDGKLESNEEWSCTIKTLKRHYLDVEAVIRKLHHYEEPEIIATAVLMASEKYEKWMINSLT